MSKKKKRVTIKHIADELQLATSTVSMALNNHPMIKEETRRMIQEYARKVNYSPNIAARAMVKGKTYLIGLLITNIQDSFFPDVIQGIEDVLVEKGYSVILCPTSDKPQQEHYYLELVRQKGVDGIICETSPGSPNRAEWQRVTKNLPVVFILRRSHVAGTVNVTVNNRRGGEMATEHLISLGHRRIAHLAGPPLLDISKDRLEGYRNALKGAGISPRDNLIVPTRDFTYETGREVMDHLLNGSDAPTAVFCASDIQALGAIHHAREKGFQVPEDISFVGFDDIPMAAIAEVPLTTVAQPKAPLGRLAAEKLIDSIDGERQTSKILMPALIQRASSAPPSRK